MNAFHHSKVQANAMAKVKRRVGPSDNSALVGVGVDVAVAVGVVSTADVG